MSATTEQRALRITGDVVVPAGAVRGQLQVMILPRRGDLEQPTALVDGKTVPVQYHHRKRRANRVDAWMLIDLKPGTHAVDLTISGPQQVALGAWLVATYKLARKSLGQRIGQQIGSNDQLFPVVAPEEDRRVATVMLPATFDLPLPPIPRGNALYLSDLKSRCLIATTGFFQFGWNRSCWPEDPVLRIGAKTYKKGLGIHAPSVASFDIGGQFKRFSAEVGLFGVPAEKKADKSKVGSCRFVVEGDGRKLVVSPLLREGDPPHGIDVDISNVKVLTLRTTNGGDSNWDDLATWGVPTVKR